MGLAEEGLQENGRQIGRSYRVIKKLGHGGDGTIYLVRHEPTEQLRAAKCLKTDPSGRRRCELDLMKRLKHPSLPQIFDVLEDQGSVWIIMEFIKGETLERLCAEEKVGPIRFFMIARQLAEALAYLHSRKPPVLHLDVKPSNIMIQPDGTLVLIDFGAAVRAGAGGAISGAAICFGTPGYAAPEQWDLRIKPDARADQYGYGAVLYYCLYGRSPGVNTRIQKKELCGDRNAGQELKWFGWRRDAAALIRRCMQKNRDRRFPDTLILCRTVKKAEKRYLARKKACRSSAAILLLLTVTVFAAANLHWNGQEEAAAAAQTRSSYEQLLEQADGLGFAQAVSCYRQAAGLCPEDSTWCDKFLGRMEANHVFSLEEETALKELMFSVPPGMTDTEEKLLERSALEYGSFAYRIGLLYWYFYEGSGGKRAAAKWFEQAAAWQERQTEAREGEVPGEADGTAAWLESAQIRAKIGGYYEMLGRQSPDGEPMAEIGIYWKDLVSLWQSDSRKQDQGGVQCELARELLSVLIMQSAELENEGISMKQLQEILTSVGAFLNEIPESEHDAKTCRELYQAAQETLERMKESERGNEFGTEKKEQG